MVFFQANFYYPFNIFGTVWFVAGPAFILSANTYIDKWVRESVVYAVLLFISFGGHLMFLVSKFCHSYDAIYFNSCINITLLSLKQKVVVNAKIFISLNISITFRIKLIFNVFNFDTANRLQI